MALSSIIGRASSPVLPLAIRTVGLGSLRSFHGDIATAIDVHERTILSPRNSFQSHSYSSAASPSPAKKLLDENLIRIIHSEIKTLKLNPVQELPIPKGFPFRFNPEVGKIVLSIHNGNERIRIHVTMADLKRSVCGDDNDHLCHSESNDKTIADKNEDKKNDSKNNSNGTDDSGDGSHKKSSGSSFQMSGVICKNSPEGPVLGFEVMASADNIAIKTVAIFDKLSNVQHDAPSDLSEKLKHALLKYLKIRGIKPSTAKYLQKYTINKNRKEELQWLKKLRRFIKK